ncbi:MAG: hypothetical protein ACRCU3_01945 [Eubacteriaceae bacterium]
MMIEEFQKLTGIYPTKELYQMIESSYMESHLGKEDFCKAYINNTNGIAEKISNNANVFFYNLERDLRLLAEELTQTQKKLEKELEWKDYESNFNARQCAYHELATASGTRILTDEEALDLICLVYGFERSKIKIHHWVSKKEINKNREIRKAGQIERLPVYNASDWNYIRFDCASMCYEIHNDELRPFFF